MEEPLGTILKRNIEAKIERRVHNIIAGMLSSMREQAKNGEATPETVISEEDYNLIMLHATNNSGRLFVENDEGILLEFIRYETEIRDCYAYKVYVTPK